MTTAGRHGYLLTVEDPFSLVGSTIDRKYRVDEPVGQGGFGIVYKGWHVQFRRHIAIKFLKVPPHFAEAAKKVFLDKFDGEGRTLFSLSEHPSIVRVFDCGVTTSARGHQLPYLILEWLNGRSLDKFVEETIARERRPCTELEIATLLLPAIDALAFAHEQGVIHRDIKPENLFVAQSANNRPLIKVLDFGIAKVLQDGDTEARKTAQTTFVAFSPNWAAPEQLYGKGYGATGRWTDVHALGLVSVFAVTGRMPLEGDELVELMQAGLAERRPTPRLRGASVSDEFEQLVTKAIALRSEDRFQDARELQIELTRFINGSGHPKGDSRSSVNVPKAPESAVSAKQVPGAVEERRVELPTLVVGSTPATTIAVRRPTTPVPGLGSKARLSLVRWVALLVLVICAGRAGVLLLSSAEKTGRIAVDVKDVDGLTVNRVAIFVDGRKQCDTPCVIGELAHGSHEVKVRADGFDAPAVENVLVERQKQTLAAFTLRSPRRAGLKASGSQPGVKLYVEGKEIGPLPQEVYDLTPGDHFVRVAGSERYEPLEKHVVVDKDQIVDLGNLTLRVLHGKATITLATPGARASIVSGSDRRDLPMLPISVDIDTTKEWSLEATRPGYKDYHQAISFDDGQAEKRFTITLEPKEPRLSEGMAEKGSGETSLWGTVQWGSWWEKDGALYGGPGTPEGWWATFALSMPGPSPNATLDVDASVVSGNPTCGFGWRVQVPLHPGIFAGYAMDVSRLGYYIGKNFLDNSVDPPRQRHFRITPGWPSLEWKPSALIARGGNHVRIEVKGHHYVVFINGQQLDAVSDTSFSTGAFSFNVSGGVVRFSNITLVEL